MAEENKQEEQKVLPKEEPKTEPKAEDHGLDEGELKSATSLYKALKDPETANEIIESLARRAGLIDKKGDLKDDKKDIKNVDGKIHKVLKAKLGKDYEKFSDTIGPLLDEAVREYLNEHTSKITATSEAEKWSNAVDNFIENREMPKKVEAKMQELIEEAPPNMGSKTFNAKRYLERMWKAALSELDMPVPGKDETDEIKDFPKNFKVIARPEKVSTDDAIDYAMKGIKLK